MTPAASDQGPVRVSREIMEGIEAVQRSGLTNMLDRHAVAEIAESMGFGDAARWVRGHRDLYARAIFGGFEVDGGSDPSASPA